MKVTLRTVILALGVVVLSCVAQAQNGPERWIVRLKAPGQAASDAVSAATEQAGGKVLHAFTLIPAVAIELPAPALQGLLRNPNVSGLIEGAEADAVVTAVGGQVEPAKGKPPPPPPPPPPPQPDQSLPWGVDRIDADVAWASSRGAGVNVAVIDTGIDKDHPDLAVNIKGGVNFVRQKGRFDPEKWDDDDGHGTHVAGIIAAVDNAIGVIGVAPASSLYAVKVLDKNGSGYVSDVIAGIQWAANNGMQAANMSLTTTADVQSLHDACDNAKAAGVVLVGAAGNSGDGNGATDEVEYPAGYDSVIAVAATDSGDHVTSWSCSGPHVDLAAPGASIYSTYKGGLYAYMSGTSMASPHVCGVVALVLADHPKPSPADVLDLLTATADDLLPPGLDNLSGAGLVDAEEAVTAKQTNP